MSMGLDFDSEELEQIFEYIALSGLSEAEKAKREKKVKSFDYKQFHDAILVNKDENWLVRSTHLIDSSIASSKFMGWSCKRAPATRGCSAIGRKRRTGARR